MNDTTGDMLSTWKAKVGRMLAGGDGEKLCKKRPVFKVVDYKPTAKREEGLLKRKGGSEDLRGDALASPYAGTTSAGFHEVASLDAAAAYDVTCNSNLAGLAELEGDRPRSVTPYRVHDDVSNQYHAIGYLPGEEVPLLEHATAISYTRHRPQGLVMIDPGVWLQGGGIDTPISPTDVVDIPWTPARPPTPWPPREVVDDAVDSSSVDEPYVGPTSARPFLVRASSCSGLQARIDSAVDADAVDKIVESYVPQTLIADDVYRMVAEANGLTCRIDSVEEGTTHYRARDTLGPHERPKSWHGATTPLGEEDWPLLDREDEEEAGWPLPAAPKRQTWHVTEVSVDRERSRDSENTLEVMERHGAGTNLFRDSLYADRRETRVPMHKRPLEQVEECQRASGFRRRCGRVARRFRPSFVLGC